MRIFNHTFNAASSAINNFPMDDNTYPYYEKLLALDPAIFKPILDRLISGEITIQDLVESEITSVKENRINNSTYLNTPPPQTDITSLLLQRSNGIQPAALRVNNYFQFDNIQGYVKKEVSYKLTKAEASGIYVEDVPISLSPKLASGNGISDYELSLMSNTSAVDNNALARKQKEKQIELYCNT